jgi:hypothetical protein
MKTLQLVATLAFGFAGASAIHAQAATATPTTSATATHTTTTAHGASFIAPRARVSRNAPTRLTPRIDGAVVRAIRSGHPLQMINPAAPAEYGNGQDVVRHEANDPYQRPEGIKLFVVEF